MDQNTRNLLHFVKQNPTVDIDQLADLLDGYQAQTGNAAVATAERATVETNAEATPLDIEPFKTSEDVRKNQPYSKEEVAQIIQLRKENVEPKEIARIIKRTPGAVYAKVKELVASKQLDEQYAPPGRRSYTATDDKLIEQYTKRYMYTKEVPAGTLIYLAKQLDRSEDAIRSRIYQMKNQ